MRLLKRLGFYGIGLFFGIIIVLYIWDEKGTTFDYLPNARVLKDIRGKSIAYTAPASRFIETQQIDSVRINSLFNEGNIDFSKSITDADSCNVYIIHEAKSAKKLVFTVTNCDSIATVTEAKFLTEEK